MEKRYLKLLVYGLVATMLVSIVSGCSGGKDSVAEELGEIISEEVSEEVIEIDSEEISIDEVVSETVSEESPEKEDESVSEVVSAEVSEEPSESMSDEKTSEQTSEVTSEAVSEKEEDSASEEKTSEEEPAFTVEPMTATMYAQRSVNVRKGPSTDYDKIGGLNTNQEVSVTGKTSTGWYEISYNGGVGYVSSSYLGNEKVVVQQTPPTQPSAPTEPTTPTQPTVPTEPTTPEVPSQPETPPADNGGLIQPIAPTEPAVPIQPTAPAEVTYEVYLNTDMLDLVNGHRTANGVKEVAWASDREQEALDRAKAVAQTYQQTNQLSHSGIPPFARCENLACSYTDSSSSGFYGQYANSSGHNTNMLTQDNSEKQHSMVSATCKISDGNNVIYINVMLFYT